MNNFSKKLNQLLHRDFANSVSLGASIIFIFGLVTVFFFPVILFNKVALPVDALVSAHVPWTEIKWEEFPAGIPIKNLEITDAFSQFYPWRSLVGNFWRAHKIPLWNNYMFSGAPFLATLHSAALYPLNVIYLFLSDVVAWNTLIFLQVLLALVFMFLLLKKITADNVASIFGSIAFSFSGYMIAWLEFSTGGQAGLWLPLLLLFLILFYESKRLIYFWLTPIIIFFILTAGDFQVPFYSLTLYLFFSVFLYKKLHTNINVLIMSFVALVFGVVLSLVQWLPSIELFSNSIRVNDPYINEYFYGIAHWEKLANFIWPDFFGNVVTRNYWGKFGYHEYLAFTGATSLALLGYGIAVKKNDYEKFFIVVLIISLLFLFPTPLAFLPFKLNIPGLATSSASRIIFIIDFCISILSAIALSKLNKNYLNNFIKSVAGLVLATAGVFIGLSISLYLFNKSGLKPDLEFNLKVAMKNMIPSTLILIVSLLLSRLFVNLKVLKINNFKLLLTLLLVAEMFRFGWKNTPFSDRRFVFPDMEIISFLQKNTKEYRIAGGIPLNLFMPYKIKSLEGYDSIYPLNNSEWFSFINSSSSNAMSGRYGLVHNYNSPLLNLSSVKYVVDYKKNYLGQLDNNGSFLQGVLPPRFKEVFNQGRVKVFENTRALPMVWVTDTYKVVEDKDLIFSTLLKSDTIDQEIVLAKKPTLANDSKYIRYNISSFEVGMNEVNVSVETNKESLLFLSQTYDSGWKAYVNGNETSILKADYLYQSVQIPSGVSEVHFVYSPVSFKIGKYLSLFVLGLILIGIIKGKKILTP